MFFCSLFCAIETTLKKKKNGENKEHPEIPEFIFLYFVFVERPVVLIMMIVCVCVCVLTI